MQLQGRYSPNDQATRTTTISPWTAFPVILPNTSLDTKHRQASATRSSGLNSNERYVSPWEDTKNMIQGIVRIRRVAPYMTESSGRTHETEPLTRAAREMV